MCLVNAVHSYILPALLGAFAVYLGKATWNTLLNTGSDVSGEPDDTSSTVAICKCMVVANCHVSQHVAFRAHRKLVLLVPLSGVLELRAATRYRLQ